MHRQDSMEVSNGTQKPLLASPRKDHLRTFNDVHAPQTRNDDDEFNNGIGSLFEKLCSLGILAQKTDGKTCPPEALLHDRGAVIPALVVSPRTEQEVARVLQTFKDMHLYGKITLSVKSGGHGYFNGATCNGVMLSLSDMTGRCINGNTLSLEPGCLLGRTVDILANHRKAVPHGDCFGVGAGGHFLTAGWDLILARKFGLGCQSVIGGRIVLWDGKTLEVNEYNHPELLYAMRGGAAAGAGVVTKLHLQIFDEPPQATWRFTRISKAELATCVAHGAFSKAFNLPRDISMSFRFHFEDDQTEPVCSLNIVSLLEVRDTLGALKNYLDPAVASLFADHSQWNEKSLLQLRLIPASDCLKGEPAKLADITSEALHNQPLDYWNKSSSEREMRSSYLTSISYWVKHNCDSMLNSLYAAFEEVQHHPARERMYALVILGGGRMNELQHNCSIPLGEALARFELHWDDLKDRSWCEEFTGRISEILQSKADPGPSRPYRGDIWLGGQGDDVRLDEIRRKYDRRFVSNDVGILIEGYGNCGKPA